MICITNACNQHSDRCPTPWTCGKYESEAHYNAMHAPTDLGGGNYLPREQAEQADTPPVSAEEMGAVATALALIVGGTIVVLAVWAGYVIFPLLAAVVHSAWPK